MLTCAGFAGRRGLEPSPAGFSAKAKFDARKSAPEKFLLHTPVSIFRIFYNFFQPQ